MKPGLISSLFLIALLCVQSINAQDNTLSQQLAEGRNKNIRQVLDFRFKGGSGEFERLLLKQVKYTEEARNNCVIGVVLMSFTVSCDNKLGELKLKNPLQFGMNEQLNAFFKSTEGLWNECSDELYTRVEIPIQFTLQGTETNGHGFIVVEGKNPGFRCKGDQYYLDQMNKYRKKGKTKRTIEMLDVLIKRDPYNQEYFELKRSLMAKPE